MLGDPQTGPVPNGVSVIVEGGPQLALPPQQSNIMPFQYRDSPNCKDNLVFIC